LKGHLNKEIANLLCNGASGILIPIIIDKLNAESDDLVKTVADLLLRERYEPDTFQMETEKPAKTHYIENATTHFILKQILTKDAEREKNFHLTLTQAILEHKNAVFIRSWIECNRGCYTLVKLLESGSPLNNKKIKVLLNETDEQLRESGKLSGAAILLEKLSKIN